MKNQREEEMEPRKKETALGRIFFDLELNYGFQLLDLELSDSEREHLVALCSDAEAITRLTERQQESLIASATGAIIKFLQRKWGEGLPLPSYTEKSIGEVLRNGFDWLNEEPERKKVLEKDLERQERLYEMWANPTKTEEKESEKECPECGSKLVHIIESYSDGISGGISGDVFACRSCGYGEVS